jgi:hypothetical protein
MRAEEIALVEAAMAGVDLPEPELPEAVIEYPLGAAPDPLESQAAQQSDELSERKRDPEY